MRRSFRHHPSTQTHEKNEQPFFSRAPEHNQMAQPFFVPSKVQTKGLAVGKPGDKYEQEADAMADAVVNHSSGTPAIHKKEISAIQRESLATPLEDEKLGTAEERMEKDKMIQEKPALQTMGEKEEEEMPVQEMHEEEEPEMQMQEEEEEPEMQMQEEEEEEAPVQTKGEAGGSVASPPLTHTIKRKAGRGKSLSGKTQTDMESAFGMDFSGVNIHTDEEAVKMNKSLRAQAFTHGKDIYFNTGKYNPDTSAGKHLLAHELTHVVQQNEQMNSVNNSIQRRLFVSGANNANVNEYLNLIGGAAGFTLRWLFSNPRVRITGNTVAGPTSESARRNLRQVINDPAQHAEIFVGTHQPRVSIGAFPGAGNTVQNVDIDDIRNLNASLPGQGTAKAFHELMENYHSHAPGGPGFGPSHQTGIEAESDVLEESGIAGRRLNRASSRTNIPDFIASMLGLPTGPNISYHFNTQEFTHYFLVMIRRVTATPAGNDFEIVRAFRVPKIQVSQRTIDSFVTGSDAIPAAGNATLNATLADLNANANTTVLIEGFTDSVGRAGNNRRLSLRRARSVQAFFIANGINANRIAIVGRGETNFVAPNNTEVNRGRNRRIVMTVHRPAF